MVRFTAIQYVAFLPLVLVIISAITIGIVKLVKPQSLRRRHLY